MESKMKVKTKVKKKEEAVPIILGEHKLACSGESDSVVPVIWVNDFDEDSARDFFESMSSFASDDMVSAMILYIDSFGGSVDSLAAMAEIMITSPKPIITVGIGKAFSAGALLLALGEPGNRWVAPNSRVMLHRLQVHNVADADADTIAQIAEEIVRMNDVWMQKLISRSKMKLSEFNKKINEAGGQWYMNAKTAVEYGFADKIGLPRIQEVRRWVLEV